MLQDLEPDPEGDAASGHPGKLHLLKDVSGVFKPRVLTCLMVSLECDAMVMLPCEATCVMHGHSASPYGCKQSSPTKLESGPAANRDKHSCKKALPYGQATAVPPSHAVACCKQTPSSLHVRFCWSLPAPAAC